MHRLGEHRTVPAETAARASLLTGKLCYLTPECLGGSADAGALDV